MQLKELGKALNSQTRLKLINLLITNPPLSSSEIASLYNTTYKENKRRETIYRELEMLVSVNLIEKKYNPKEKKLNYHLISRKLELNLDSGEIHHIK
jgi:Fe2+ or Zn2+ uptake regulation protein